MTLADTAGGAAAAPGPPGPHRALSKAQKLVLTAAFVPMLGTGVAGGIGTYTNIKSAYGAGTAAGAVAAGEGATAVLALVLLGLTMLGQSSPMVVRAGLWLLPAAAAAMSLMAADDPGQKVIYAVTPMGMTVAAEGAAFLARRIVVHQNGGRDAEADARAAAVVRELAYHRARAQAHPQSRKRRASERTAWRLARRVGQGDPALAGRLLDIQRDRLQSGADAALESMFGGTPDPAPDLSPVAADPADRSNRAALENTEESTQQTTKWSPPDLVEAPSGTGVESGPDSGAQSGPVAPDPGPRQVPVVAYQSDRRVVAADRPRPSRVTRPVPPAAARTHLPRRSWDELLTQARKQTADWPDGELTANAIRLAMRTSSVNARRLRDALRADRGSGPEAGEENAA